MFFTASSFLVKAYQVFCLQVSEESVQTSGSGPDKMEFGDKGIDREKKKRKKKSATFVICFLSPSVLCESGSKRAKEMADILTLSDLALAVEMPVSWS